MAASVTVSEETFGSVKKITWSWTSAADGTASGTTTNTYNGKLERLVVIPGSAGDQPTDNYDLVINDGDGVDVLMGVGGNCSNANTEQAKADALGVVANDQLTLEVTNAGNAKSVTVHLYLR